MKQEDKNKPAQEKRKFLLVLPLLVIPFLTMGFYALGGGKGTSGLGGQEVTGINASLPDAKKQDKDLNGKLSFYELAEKDSLKKLALAKQDPYYVSEQEAEQLYDFPIYKDTMFTPAGAFKGMDYKDPNEQKVYEKLNQLTKAMDENGKYQQVQQVPSQQEYGNTDIGLRQDIDRLEQMMQNMQTGSGQQDPEMANISSVLESVLDIQHPQRVEERLKQQSKDNMGQVFAVSASQASTPISLLDNIPVAQYAQGYKQNPQSQENKFYGLEENGMVTEEHNGIAAVVHETQTLVSGSTVKLRLLSDVFINGTLIPKDQFIFGTASLRGERLEIQIESIRFANSLFPVKLTVHDMDGLAGIHIPGAITRDVAKQSGDQALQGVSLGTLSPSLGAQAASAGIELGRNLLSKKIKLIKVEVKAGYRVLLKDGKKKQY